MADINALRKTYVRIASVSPVRETVLDQIEKYLAIKLPSDFRNIAAFFSGDLLGGIDHYEIALGESGHTVVEETVRLRKAIGLPQRFLALAEPPESFIALETQENSNSLSRVIWCDAVEAPLLGKETLQGKPEIWNSYSDFFSYLLDREEEERSS
jgi:hypothetical protein